MTTQVETIEDIIEAANHLGWYLVTLCQYGMKGQIVYRATFQHRTLNGATENVFNEYEDAPDAVHRDVECVSSGASSWLRNRNR